jgi:hypothetical protein
MTEELKQFLDEERKINEIRTADYKKLKVIMEEYCGFTNLTTQNEPCYINLWAINSFVESFESKAILSEGKSKDNALKHLKTLYEIQQQYGKFYFESIIYREKVAKLERNQFKFIDKIKELQKEVALLQKQIEF